MVDSIIKQIKAWNCEDIHELRLMFRRLSNAIANERMRTPEISRVFTDHLDVTTLPTVRFFEELDIMNYVGHPVWAMDKRGYCLTGKSMDMVSHIVEIDELNKEAERNSKRPPVQPKFGTKIKLRGRRKDFLGGAQ